jgi:pimeloyl-ACP methyl ester carboxylesterase
VTERILTVDEGVELCAETFGDPEHPALVVIAGGASSMDYWDAGLCRRLAGAGLFVVRYDHRDTGRSSASPPGSPSYTGVDLATDPLRVLDALGVTRAHLAGVSMGGGISQELAAHRPDRVLSITLIAASAAGERDDDRPLPPPSPRLAATFDDPVTDPDWSDRDAVVDHLLATGRLYAGSLGFDAARERRLARAMVDRTRDIRAATTNHWILEGESAPFRLADIRVPTLVLHGTDDPMFPFPHGEALAAGIPGARLVPLEGMGHEHPPPPVWDTVVREVAAHTAAATARR